VNHLFKLQAPRTDAALKLGEPAVSGYVHKEGEEEKGVKGLITKLVPFSAARRSIRH
jgi:hypothetical protein